jgi:hypothetical protein
MPDNCYWIGESGAYELCFSVDLPGLPTGWIQYDSLPDAIIGRAGYTTYPPISNHPQSGRPAYGNGNIVIACAFSYGVQPAASNGSHETYGVFVSQDDGFTYGDLIEKFTWLPGGPYFEGYDANGFFYGQIEHFGTAISFDGTDFYVVSTTNNNTADNELLIITSKSSDGLSWSNITTNAADHDISLSDSYGGKVWYLGTNSTIATYTPFPADAFTVGYSGDDGATWTTATLVAPNYAAPDDVFVACSANQDGFHMAMQSYVVFWGIVYYRPTGNSSWDTPVDLFDFALGFYEDFGVQLIASRIDTNNIYASVNGYTVVDSYDCIYFRRSGDGGLTWSSDITAWEGDATNYLPSTGRFNRHQLVELADERLVVVFVYNDGADDNLAYVISSDNGVTWGAATVLETAPFLIDNYFYNARIYACARGNDVIVTQCDRVIAGNTYIFRP